MAKMNFPLQIQRQYEGPLDPDMVFSTAAEMTAYLTNSRRYAGQAVTCLGTPGRVFVLNASRDAWVENAGDATYVHVQIAAAAVWNVVHNLGKYPSVTVVDSAGSTVIGEVSYIDANNVQLTFTSQFSGKAYMN